MTFLRIRDARMDFAVDESLGDYSIKHYYDDNFIYPQKYIED